MKNKDQKTIKAEVLDEIFDSGSDKIDEYFDYDHARRPNMELKRVNSDFPAWVVAAMDREAERIGVARIAVLKMWAAEKAMQQK